MCVHRYMSVLVRMLVSARSQKHAISLELESQATVSFPM